MGSKHRERPPDRLRRFMDPPNHARNPVLTSFGRAEEKLVRALARKPRNDPKKERPLRRASMYRVGVSRCGGRVEGSWRAMCSSGVGTRVGGHRYGLVGARDSLSTLTRIATRLMHVPSHAPHWNPVPSTALLMPEGVWTLLVPQGKCNHPLRGYVDR